MRDVAIATQREPVVARDSRGSFRIEFRGTSDARSALRLQQDFDGAHAHYQLALGGSQAIGYRPEVALTRLEIAELLLEHYPDEQYLARTHLEAAASEFSAMRMQPFLARANTRLEAERNAAPEELTAGGLTPRERDVAGLVAVGRSNREIASELVISGGTVEVHVIAHSEQAGVQIALAGGGPGVTAGLGSTERQDVK